MKIELLKTKYFDWICGMVIDDSSTNNLSYKKLLSYLYMQTFEYSMDIDENRAEDGIALRYRFGYDKKYSESTIEKHLDYRPCSTLEMLIGLAFRYEENIMEDLKCGNRTGQWFWNMIVNLGLGGMSDRAFDSNFVDDALSHFYNRTYKRNGKGGLFTISNPDVDMRDVEIWYQMAYYLDENEL